MTNAKAKFSFAIALSTLLLTAANALAQNDPAGGASSSGPTSGGSSAQGGSQTSSAIGGRSAQDSSSTTTGMGGSSATSSSSSEEEEPTSGIEYAKEPDVESDCGCRVIGQGNDRWPAFAGLLLGAAYLWRRRRTTAV